MNIYNDKKKIRNKRKYYNEERIPWVYYTSHHDKYTLSWVYTDSVNTSLNIQAMPL